MVAVRFHGRGGQGAKTASRILGTAAFMSGYVAQDCPIYGAERRGAPVAAFTRFGREPIRERGAIAHPDVIVVADATLLDDVAARVLEGVDDRTVLFVNTSLSTEALRAHLPIPLQVTARDVTGIALQQLGQREAISALLGAVAARLVGLDWESLRSAIGRELEDLGLPEPVIQRNLTVAKQCYESVEPAPLHKGQGWTAGTTSLHSPAYEPPTKGTARISGAGNSVLRETGGWRTFRPVLVADKCNGCWLCFAYCPDGVIAMNRDDRPVVDYAHCKGCQICIHECPTHALVAEREQEGGVAWTAK
ncbi:MAG TPA: 2-oxoacid:acceptor oxidoreductase family protein [Nitrospira sp.]|nr:2-oxoacid:acceptor oxidoreductase family protein [Nitrospira sp.]HNK16213.1 2-oxoacid:acceptor oxidoreductase family protein [Nitrospira sp.]HNL91123.1 2-oxoacid:acceptor oxidoreductase family protein [Nitrospira sp.]